MWPLTDPVVPVDLYEIADRGRRLPAGTEEFNEFLKGYIAQWADEPSPPDFAQAA
jgi:hypothetical protein